MESTASACMCTCVLRSIWLFVTPWTVACQAPLSTGFSRQCWSGMPFPPPGYLPDPRIEPTSLVSPVLAGEFFTTELPGKLCVFDSTKIVHVFLVQGKEEVTSCVFIWKFGGSKHLQGSCPKAQTSKRFGIEKSCTRYCSLGERTTIGMRNVWKDLRGSLWNQAHTL